MTPYKKGFADLLRSRRREVGLTQEKLAELAGISTRTVSDLERGAKKRPHPGTVRMLAAALGLSEQQIAELDRAIAEVKPSAIAARAEKTNVPTVSSSKHNLPIQHNSFIGRDRELRQVRQLLTAAGPALITLTGVGGTGKTRLALQIALDLLDYFTDGIYFVDLAPLVDSNLLTAAIGTALGVKAPPDQSLLDYLKVYLRGKQLLLLLDNFEHLVDQAPLLAELVAAATRLRVLVTSRAPLRMRGEHELEVLPLDLPVDEASVSVAQLLGNDAVRLFVERSRFSRPGFNLTEANASVVVDIVRQLDGLPLAIELAAARSNILAPQDLLLRLESRLGVLTRGQQRMPARQQTLRNAIGWSYDLLSAIEQSVFAALAVFRGGWTLAAAEQILGDYRHSQTAGTAKSMTRDVRTSPEDTSGKIFVVLDALSALAENNLIYMAREGDSIFRFTMLETIREFASERLEASNDEDQLRQRHAMHYLELAGALAARLTDPRQGEWLTILEEEHDNMRAALHWSLRAAPKQRIRRLEIGLRLSGALWRFWDMHGHFIEGRQWLTRLLHEVERLPFQADSEVEVKPLNRAQANALTGAGLLAWRQGEYSAARTALDAALRLYQQLGDEEQAAISLRGLGNVSYEQGDYLAAHAFYDQGLSISRQLGNKQGIASSLSNLGDLSLTRGDYAEALRFVTESLAFYRQLDDKRGIAIALNNLGNVAYEQCQYDAVRPLLLESMVIARELKDSLVVAACLTVLAGAETQSIQASSDRFDMAKSDRAEVIRNANMRVARLLGAAEELLKTIGGPLGPVERRIFEQATAIIRNRLGDQEFQVAWHDGRSLSLEHAVAYAHEVTLV